MDIVPDHSGGHFRWPSTPRWPNFPPLFTHAPYLGRGRSSTTSAGRHPGLAPEMASVIEEPHPHIAKLMRAAGEARPPVSREEIGNLFRFDHPPVILHLLLHHPNRGTVLEAQDLFQAQLWVERPECRLSVFRRNPEALVKSRQELLQHAVG